MYPAVQIITMLNPLNPMEVAAQRYTQGLQRITDPFYRAAAAHIAALLLLLFA